MAMATIQDQQAAQALVADLEAQLAAALAKEAAESTEATTPSDDSAVQSPIRSELLRTIDALIARYFILSQAQRILLALWVIHTYLVDVADQTPYIAITSPEPRCGKSFLLELLELLVSKGWYVTGPSEPVVFRTIHGSQPTLLLDEYDTIFGPKTAQFHEGLRQLLNVGHRPGARVPRCVGQSLTPQDFNVYCPKALGGIGHLPATVADRAIVILMKRKTPNENVDQFRKRRVIANAGPVAEKIRTWAGENREALKGAEPELPEQLNDRMQDACECLIAIADLLGDGELARQAIIEVVAEEPESHETTKLKVLRDLRTLYAGWRKTNMPTNVILPALHAHDPFWNNYYDRGPLKDTDLAGLLSYFGIKPKTVWIPDGAITLNGQPRPGHDAKGYKYDELADAFARYLNDDEAGQ
jgi:hypothetical protein